jgi:hypothetical protein
VIGWGRTARMVDLCIGPVSCPDLRHLRYVAPLSIGDLGDLGDLAVLELHGCTGPSNCSIFSGFYDLLTAIESRIFRPVYYLLCLLRDKW